MTPVGVELDAAVLKAMGWTYHPRIGGEGAYWRERFDSPNGGQSRFMDMPDERDYFSTDHNGHEALRLCGPWLDERCISWGITSSRHEGGSIAEAVLGADDYAWTEVCATRAETIARLVLAVAEREGT